MCWKGLEIPIACCASAKRPGSPITIGSVSATAAATAKPTSLARVPAGAAISTGRTASAAHCLVASAHPSKTPAASGRRRAAASSAPTQSAPPSTSSGCPYFSAL